MVPIRAITADALDLSVDQVYHWAGSTTLYVKEGENHYKPFSSPPLGIRFLQPLLLGLRILGPRGCRLGLSLFSRSAPTTID